VKSISDLTESDIDFSAISAISAISAFVEIMEVDEIIEVTLAENGISLEDIMNLTKLSK
jgi:hypothetical protein